MLTTSSYDIISAENTNKDLTIFGTSDERHSDNSTSNSIHAVKPEVGNYGFQLNDYVVSEKVKDYISTEDNYECCPNCQRKFFLGRLKLHMKSCKEGKPLKLKRNIEGATISISSSSLTKQPLQGSLVIASNFREDEFQNEDKFSDIDNFQSGKDKKQNAKMDIKKDSARDSKYSKAISNTVDYDDDEDDGIGIVEKVYSDDKNNYIEENENINNEVDRVPCSYCGRSFDASRVEKHETACAKSQKKRKVFDTKKQRVFSNQTCLNF